MVLNWVIHSTVNGEITTDIVELKEMGLVKDSFDGVCFSVFY